MTDLQTACRLHSNRKLGELARKITPHYTLDESGPARVLSLLLVRAPGWPTGPGNPDDAVLEAQKAVERSPKHPLNELALAEALAATGDPAGAKAACERASALASARADADGADWVAQAQALFEKL